MCKHSTVRVYTFVLFALALTASPARAQFAVRTFDNPAIGERYHIEASGGYWSPKTQMSISSESLGIPGDVIDFKSDLGLTDQRFREVHLVLRPAKKHKLRYQYIPIKFTQNSVVTRDITFNGQLYHVGLPVNSSIDWKAHRFGYEYDFLTKDRGFGGFILDVKYTDVAAELDAPGGIREAAHATAPIPAIGGIFRAYVIPNVSITGEVTGFALPKRLIKNARAHYVDADFYGTVNLTNYLGAQLGYRTLDLGYAFDDDTGDFQLKGFYFGLVARY